MNQRFFSVAPFHRSTIILIAATLVAIFATFSSTATAFAQYGGYLIDGNVPDAGVTEFDDPEGNANELGPHNGSSNQLGVIHTDPLSTLDFTDPPGKTDFRRVWLDTNVDANDDVWLYFGWERDANSGSGVIMFEFQKAGVPVGCDYSGTPASLIANCNPFSGRQPGDFIIVWDQEGGATDIYRREFTFNDNNPNNGQWDGAVAEPLSLSAGILLNSTVSKAAYDGTKFFGEAAINLTDSGIFPSSPTSCLTVGNVIPSTGTGNSDTADFKDIVLGNFASVVNISSCGQVRITKQTVPTNLTGSFPYTLKRADNSALEYGVAPAITKSSTLTGHNDSDLYIDLKAGTNYTLTEGSLVSPWALSAITCNTNGVNYNVYPGNQLFEILPSVTTTCIVTNEVQMGKLVVIKDLVNDDGGTKNKSDFTFSVTGSFPVNNGQPQAFTASGITTLTVPVGAYNVTEQAATGYTTTYSPNPCTNLQVTNNGTTTCIITNNDQPGTLIVKKIVINDNGGSQDVDDFTFSVNNGTAIAFEADGQNNLTVDAGSYAITEPAVSGYTTSYDNCENIVIPNGGTATCTITNNDDAPSLTLVKVVVNNNNGNASESDWTLSATGPTSFSGLGPNVTNGASFDAGTYILAESNGPAGYSASLWSCQGGQQIGASITVGLGESAICTITNDDDAPSLKLVKKASPLTYSSVGTVISYTYTLSNTGQALLSQPFTVADDKATVTCPAIPTSIATGESIVCTTTYIITQQDLNTGSVTNVAQATAKDPFDKDVVSNQDDETVTAIQSPSIAITKDAEQENYDEVGEVISYTLVATNTGNVTLHNVSISDPKLGTLVCVPSQPTTLAPGAILTCAGDYVVTQADVDAGQVDNTATADSTETPPDEDDETVPALQDPEITLNKEAVQANYNEVGDVISYTLVATNTGNVTLSDVEITDPKITVLSCTPSQPTTLLPGATISCTGSYTVTQADLDLGHFDNTATVTGKDPDDAPVSDTDDETVPAVQSPALVLNKEAVEENYNEPGDVISYTLVATNTGNVTLHNVTISDPKLGSLTCTPLQPATLAPGAILTCVGDYTVTQSDVDAGQVDNEATADSDEADPDKDDETVPAVQEPALELNKEAVQPNYNEPGDVISYTLVATNTGNVTLSDVEITDPKITVLSCTPPQPTTLLPGATISCTGSYTVTQADLNLGHFDNEATATGKDPDDAPVSDKDDETVPAVQEPEITLTKDAEQSYFNEAGDVITYTLVAENTGNVTLDNVQISDPMLGALATCTPVLGSTLAPGETITCTDSYTVVADDVTAKDVDNTATATGTPPTGPDVDDTDDEIVPLAALNITKKATQTSFDEVGDVIDYTLIVTNTGNIQLTGVTISDAKLGTLVCTPTKPATLAIGASMTCTGSYTTDQGDLDAGEVINTATADSNETGPDNDTETVDAIKDAEITLIKEAVQENYNEVGDVISYTLIATNTGNLTLTNVKITDPKITVLSCTPSQPTTLLPGEGITCTGSYTVTQSDVDAGEVVNQATADSDETEPDDDTETVPGIQNPALDIDKTGTEGPVTIGDTVFYTITVENVGNVTLYDVIVTDDKLELEKNVGTLSVGQTAQITATYGPVTEDDLPGPIFNTAGAIGTTPDEEPTEPVTDTHEVPVDFTPALTIDKTGTEGPVTINDTVFYTITVQNTGNVTLTNVTVTDEKLGLVKNVGTLKVGDTAVVTDTYGPVTEQDLPGPIFNTAGVTGTTPTDEPTKPVTDTHEVPVSDSPALDIDKTGTEGPVTIGDTVFYTITIRNVGNVTLNNVTVTDEKLGVVENVGTLAVNQTAQVTGSYGPITEDDLPGPIFNTAGVTGTTPTDEPTTPVTDTHEVPVTINPVLTLVKTATPTTFTVVGQTITYSYLLTNDGNVTLKAPFTVADDKTTVTCPDQPTTLAVGESMTCTATYIITQADYDNGSVTNVAQATAKDPKNDDVLSNEDEETVTREDLPVTVAGRVWYDDNANGLQDENEPNVENVTVNLLAGDCTTSLNQSTTTDSNGNYAFSDLTPGSYCVEFESSTLPSDYKLTEQNAGDNDTVDSDPDPLTGKTTSITLASGESNETTDAGIVLKSLLITATPVCIDDAPYLEYSITPVNLTPGENPVTIRWIDVDNDAVLYELTNQPLNATLLWPEAGVDGNGVGNQWPGWSFVDGVWVDNGSNLRPQVKVEFEVNPTEAVLVDYPAGDPNCSTAPRGTIGDTVWNDANNNGLQDNGEAGIPGVKVDLYKADGTLVATTTTNADGQYEFTGVIKGDYYLEFTTPAGYNFTRYQVNGNSQDGADSNAQAPTILLTVTDGDEEGEFDQNMTYTLNYTNTDAARSASNVVITTTIPAGTSFVAADSTTGWSCTDVVEGSVCTFTIPTLAADSSGNINFVVKLKGEDQANEVPDALDLIVHLTQSNVARTETITMPDGGTNRTVDAGLVRTEASEQTPTPTDPTSLPGGEQPKQRMDLFLPALRLSAAPAESSSTPQVEEDQPEAQQQAVSTYLPTVETQE